MSKFNSRKNRRKNVQRTRTIETLEKREMFSTAPWGGQVEIESHVEPLTAVVASNPGEQVAVTLIDGGILNIVGTQEDDSIHVRENRRGQVIVESDVGSGGSLSLVARKGSVAAGTSNAFFDVFRSLVLNDRGKIAFKATLSRQIRNIIMAGGSTIDGASSGFNNRGQLLFRLQFT